MLTGKNLIAGDAFDSEEGHFTSRGTSMEFEEASSAHVDWALDAAERASHEFRQVSAERRAALLDRIAEEIEHAGDLLDVANLETALPPERLAGERGRTAGQLRMFARLVREGSWVDARIDRAVPDRKPLPKPDIRRMLIPIGPVAVFAASNFPLAFSVAGGDTASALAAGCPVVVKAHPAHPATSELAARAIITAVTAAGMPPGIFSLIQSTRHDVATAVVQHRHTRAVGFTGSLRGGRALFDAAARRPDPIPVYAEMGSVNPVFLLPDALAERAEAIAEGLAASVTLGVGQFCTNPGVVVGVSTDSFERFVRRMHDLIRNASPGVMLYPALFQSFEAGVRRLSAVDGTSEVRSSVVDAGADGRARPALFETSAPTFMQHRELSEEVFGPSTVVVRCGSDDEMAAVARRLEGQLTATIHGTTTDLATHAWLVSILQDKAGRLVVNGFPTGVEVCASMQHGGPYPATTDSRTTSVGTAAITRFARPVAYQNFPQSALPVELQDANPRAIWRWVDGEMTKDALGTNDMRRLLITAFCLTAGLLGLTAQVSGTLTIYYIDTEGGQSTLFVGPAGESLLVDTGNAGDRDLGRIVETLQGAGITRIEHLWITHYHGDHVGALLALARQVPVMHFYDHGAPNRNDRIVAPAFLSAYEDLSRGKRTTVKPGDKVRMAGLDITTVASANRYLRSNLPGGGGRNASCTGVPPKDESAYIDADNGDSAGFVLVYGRFRTVDLGDLTWNGELDLMCPTNRIGPVDLYLTSHHGLERSGSPALVHALQPRVAIMNNGTRKGGTPDAFRVLHESPGLKDLWQLHWSHNVGLDNAPAVFVANVEDAATAASVLTAPTPVPGGRGGPPPAAHSPAYLLKVTARPDGTFTVTNTRNGFTKTYRPR